MSKSKKTAVADAPAATSTKPKKGFAPFKQGSDGYLMFGKPAVEVAAVLGLETTDTSAGTTMLKIELDAFDGIKATLEAHEPPYNVQVEVMKPSVTIKTFTGGAIVFGESNEPENAAALVAAHLGLETAMTQSNPPVPMVRISTEQVESVQELLGEKYLVRVRES